MKNQIKTMILYKLFINLQISVQTMLYRLRDKLLVLFVATPLEEKNQKIDEKDKFMVNFSEILDDFQE